jgi:predicted NAD-dependent protein-ADP-ribosyltransferase YbiA (DUF1768 family)
VTIDWHRLRTVPTPEIVRAGTLAGDEGAGVLWSSESTQRLELSAVGVIAWEGRTDKPSGDRYEWVGFNLLCNAAPTTFVLDGERFSSIDSFYEALKIPEASPDRAACASASLHDAKRIARPYRAASFSYRRNTIAVGSPEHEAILAAGIVAKVDQHPEVQAALRDTGAERLVFPGASGSNQPGVLARVTPLTLMIERWKRFGPGA